jgi:hypothetical protein
MATTMTFNVDVDAGDSPKTLKSLKEELEAINEQLEQTEIGSRAFTELSDKARNTSSEIKTLEKTFEGLEPQQKTEAFVKGFEAVAGAVAIGAGSMALFGVESERLGKLEEKVQGAIAIAVGARSIAEGALQAKIAARLIAEKATTVAAKAQIAVQTALNAVLNANPIGLIILGVTAAVAIFTTFGDKIKSFIKSALGPLNSALEVAGRFLRQVGSAIGIVASEEEVAAEKAKELSTAKIEQYERELKVAKARGKDTIEIEKNILKEKMKLYKADSKEYKDLQSELLALTEQRAREEEAKRVEAAKKRREEYAAQKNEAKKQAQEIAQEAELIGLDSEQRAIALENRKYEQQLATLKKFKLDTTQLEALHQDNLAQIQNEAQKKRDDAAKAAADKKVTEDAQREKDYQSLLLNIRDAQSVTEDQKRSLELTKLTEYYDQLIAEAEKNNIDTANLEDAKNTALSLKKDEFRAQDTEKEKAYQQQIADLTIGAATDLISTLTSLNELFSGDSEEQQKKAFKRNQSLQIAQTIIDTFRSATGAFQSLASIPVVGPALGGVAAAAAVAAGLANVKKIKQQKFEGVGASGGSTPSGGGQGGGVGVPTATGNITPIGQLAQGSILTPQFNNQQQPQRAYVLSGDVKDGLEADKRIEQRRTIGG